MHRQRRHDRVCRRAAAAAQSGCRHARVWIHCPAALAAGRAARGLVARFNSAVPLIAPLSRAALRFANAARAENGRNTQPRDNMPPLNFLPSFPVELNLLAAAGLILIAGILGARLVSTLLPVPAITG